MLSLLKVYGPKRKLGMAVERKQPDELIKPELRGCRRQRNPAFFAHSYVFLRTSAVAAASQWAYGPS